MSSQLRQLQKKLSGKPRKRKPKGPAQRPKAGTYTGQPRDRRYDMLTDKHKVNEASSKCKDCFGTGLPAVYRIGAGPDDEVERVQLVCHCVPLDKSE